MNEAWRRTKPVNAQLPQCRRDSSTWRIMVANILELAGKFAENLPII
jgi:hypothetical protein